MKNTLKWYDWIPIVGILATMFRGATTPPSFEVFAFLILQLGSLAIAANLLKYSI